MLFICFPQSNVPFLSLQTSTTKRLVFLPCGPRQLQYKSISVLKRYSTTSTSYTLPLGKRTAIGAVFTGKRRRSSAKIWLRRRRRTVVWDKQESVLLSAVIGDRRSSSSLIRSSVLEEIEGQGQVYFTLVRSRGYAKFVQCDLGMF